MTKTSATLRTEVYYCFDILFSLDIYIVMKLINFESDTLVLLLTTFLLSLVNT